MMRSEKGSALVLTLLFITLLTTMSTAMYLYASKQSMFADSNYTNIAAGYVADAGLEMGKGLLIDQDSRLNTYGQNPGDGVITRNDYPVILPISADVGRYDTSNPSGGERITDNKQGVGNYALRIDAAYSEIVDFEVQLRRTVGFSPGTLMYGSFTRVNRLLPGENLKVQIRQGIEVVNDYAFNFHDTDTIEKQVSGTTTYQPITMTNIINPFIGDDISIEMNRTDISQQRSGFAGEHDAWGNKLVAFDGFVDRDYAGNLALDFTVMPNRARSTYVLEAHNLNTGVQNDIEIAMYYWNGTSNVRQVIIRSSDWGPAAGDRLHAILDFSVDGGFCRNWERQRPGQPNDHVRANSLPTQAGINGPEGIIMEVTSPGMTWQEGMNITISRGIPGEVTLGLKMRTEGMDPDCWWPDYPNCNVGTPFQDIMVLSEFDDSVDYLLTPDMLTLGHQSRISVHELYTITSVGNVEDANETRQLMVSPVSFMDYARFTQSRLTLGSGSMFGGLVYSTERIELPAPGPGVAVFLYDDLVTSSRVVNPGSAVFPTGKGQIIEDFPLVEFPDLLELHNFYNNNRDNAWEIGSYHHLRTYDLFLGNYDYVNTASENEFWGLNFATTPATYTEPNANILQSESYSYRNGWVPGAHGPSSQSLPHNFNGLIFVNGDVHVWGTLHGKSVTIFARGDIYVEREIIMGTDELEEVAIPQGMSKKDGMPVHCNLVPLLNTGNGYQGDVIISENAPRIMRIESGIMAFAGALTTEDNDWDPANLDADNSHKFYFPDPPAPNSATIHYTWSEEVNWPNSIQSYDLNNDGRLTDGSNYAPDGLPFIELGTWNELDVSDSDEIWYLMIVGPFVDRDGASAGHYAARGMMTVAGSENGNTRNYRYDPSYRINAPPFVPAPENTLRVLPWIPYVNELPN